MLTVTGVNLSFGSLQVLRSIDISVNPGEFVALVGPSGCGKSSLLNIIAGLEQPDSGTIQLDGAPVTKRLGLFAYMPQHDALLPWRSVLDNAILAAEVAGVDRNNARRRARELLPAFGLEGFADAYPDTLSGGMRQRAAFLRTILSDRPILLLDEPFGALDALTRRLMQEWLLGLTASLGRSVLMVTHDLEEALMIADRVALMTARPGRIKWVEDVTLPRPRHPEMAFDPAFVEQKARLLDELRSEFAGVTTQQPAVIGATR